MSTTPKPVLPRIPPDVAGIQVNFCKNQLCLNYGKPASLENQKRRRRKKGAATTAPDTYTVGASGKDQPRLICDLCGESFAMKSNLGIAEELQRISAPLQKPHVQLTCPKEDCANNAHSVFRSPRRYMPFGKTKAGNPRFRCRICGKTFTVKHPRSAIDRQRSLKYKNFEIFEDLMAKMPFRRISFKHRISMERVYAKLVAFQKQFVAFAASRERKFKNLDFKELDFAIDRQAYRLNWTSRGDRRNVMVLGVASAEMNTGYVFGHHLDYDSTVDSEEINAHAEEIGDLNLKPPFRRYARFWIEGEVATPPTGKPEEVKETRPIKKLVKETYAEAVVREDIEVPQEDFSLRMLPTTKGMQVHPEYTLYAHFFYLKNLLPKFDKINFYMDQESGIRAASLSAFWEDILAKKVDAFYVQIDKTLTQPQKESLVAQVDRNRDEYISENPELEKASMLSIRQLQIERQLANREKIGPWKDEWLEYPFPDMSEPRKAISWLTDLDDGSFSNFELAKLFLKGSLHRVDSYFSQLRRMTSLLERPFITPTSGRATYHAYDPYKPEVIEMLLDIYRTYYNYVKVGDDGQTPAMRLGVAKAPIKLEKILYFKENPKFLFS